MENNKKSIILAIVLLLVVVIAGVSFAYFSAIITGSESSSTIYMDAGELSITYSDNSNALDVSATKIYPRDEEWITKKFKVTGNNTTELAMYYKVKLVMDNNEFEDSLTYSLDSVNTSDNGAVIASIAEGTISGTTTEELGQGYFIEGEGKEHNYTLKIYFKDNNEDQNEYQKAKFTAHIEIEGTDTNIVTPSTTTTTTTTTTSPIVIPEEPIVPSDPAPTGWHTATSGTLLAGIKTNYNAPTEPLTTPGTEVSTSTEAVMAAASDDYGTSYYFRGNVQNNYVVFANMCWRIVRITGDGSIKLVLYNYSSNNCTQTGDTLAFARYSGTTYTTYFNQNADNNAYVGFMYGSTTGSDYGSTHANTTKSTILTNLETWYTANISSYESKLADTIWCNDKSITSGNGVGTTATNYGANGRINNPSLICPENSAVGKLSKFTVADTSNGNGALDKKIGLLTMDEIIFAGLIYNSANTNSNYLSSNANSVYWTMSPRRLSFVYGAMPESNNNMTYNILLLAVSAGATASQVWAVSSNLLTGYEMSTAVHMSGALRPALSLKSTVTISSGNGSASSPFTIS